MASPHLAGAVALLWSAVPSLIGDIDRTEQVFLKSATPVPAVSCGTSATLVSPNNLYGFGRLNVQAAVLLARSSRPLELALNDNAGNPVTATAASLVDQLTGFSYAADSLEMGSAGWSAVYSGAYDLVYTDDSGNNYRRPTILEFQQIWLPIVNRQ
jgi:subtilisin family serine protease